MAYVELSDGNIIETDRPGFWTEGKRLTAKDGKAKMRAQALRRLHSILKPGDTVHCALRHVSSSGMSRRISFFKLADGSAHMLDGYIIELGIGDRPRGNADGVLVGGCGMDMGFHVVYNLGAAMWPNGTPEPHGSRNGEPDTLGGYALRSEWL